ncbi:lysoplasmalogenase [Prolixibacteraceae bacterium Z1-6]|uniref:Lysoplasmalogenase n=1 Tax=Draconibacterium aestuarii TaxID=2998507 RepID=A0A9X3J6H4_9BACT|nr:lysoplasmalogenase [Prolixibacteraceae bacterium Z1-6]
MMKKKFNNKSIYILVIAPVIMAFLALNLSGFVYKSGTAITGIIILLLLYFRNLSKAKDIISLLFAFVFSIVGDWFLSNMRGDVTMFVYGIAFYFLAHLGYLFYALMNGQIKWKFTFVLLVAFLVFFIAVLYPSIDDKVLLMTTLIYLVISCLSLGAAVGIRTNSLTKWTYVFGIFLILFSDTIISLKEFVKYTELNFLILPTYYLAHIFIIFSLISRRLIND